MSAGRLTFRRDESHTSEAPVYRVLLDGEDIGQVYRRTGTSAGYFGAWATRSSWASSRQEAAEQLAGRYRARRSGQPSRFGGAS